jgi:hypothetical protein
MICSRSGINYPKNVVVGLKMAHLLEITSAFELAVLTLTVPGLLEGGRVSTPCPLPRDTAPGGTVRSGRNGKPTALRAEPPGRGSERGDVGLRQHNGEFINDIREIKCCLGARALDDTFPL